LRAPPSAIIPRIEKEGFDAEPRRKKADGAFHRVDPRVLAERLVAWGFRIDEVVAVAPALGPETGRIDAVRKDPKAWAHLLELEETIGRSPDRWPPAAAVLLAAVGPHGPGATALHAAPKSEG
jgi:hypothetical protein